MFFVHAADAGVGRKNPGLCMGGTAIPQAGIHPGTISTTYRKKKEFTKQPTTIEGATNCVVIHQIVKGEAYIEI